MVKAAHELQMMPTTEGGLDLKLDLTHVLDGFSGNEHSLPIVPLYKDVVELVARRQPIDAAHLRDDAADAIQPADARFSFALRHLPNRSPSHPHNVRAYRATFRPDIVPAPTDSGGIALSRRLRRIGRSEISDALSRDPTDGRLTGVSVGVRYTTSMVITRAIAARQRT